MSVAWIESRKRAIVVSPRQGATDGPTQPYPTARPNGRGSDRPVLPHRRCLRAAQPEREALRAPQAALGFGGHNPRSLATASGRGERALLLARRPGILPSPVPWRSGSSSFPVAPQGAQALSAAVGALQASPRVHDAWRAQRCRRSGSRFARATVGGSSGSIWTPAGEPATLTGCRLLSREVHHARIHLQIARGGGRDPYALRRGAGQAGPRLRKPDRRYTLWRHARTRSRPRRFPTRGVPSWRERPEPHLLAMVLAAGRAPSHLRTRHRGSTRP